MPERLRPAPALAFDDVLLVPQRTRARSRRDIDVSTRISRRRGLNIPIVSANVPWCTEAPMAAAMARCGGIGILHRMTTIESQVAALIAVKAAPVLVEGDTASLDGNGRLAVGAAIGVRDEDRRRAERLVEAGVDLLVIDIAHGHADYVLDLLAELKARYPTVDVVAGNVATPEGVEDLIAAGADAVKVGIGPGGICTTRQVAGAGMPQFTAILDCAAAASAKGVPVIADGGIRSSGDIVKALAAGASCVMLGSLLAGSDESAALPVDYDGRRYRTTTGFVSLGVQLTRKRLRQEQISEEEIKDYVPEGVEATFVSTGPVADHLRQLIGGVQSGLSYSGALSIAEMQDKARFVQVTTAGRSENKPHSLDRAPQIHPDFKAQFLAEAKGDG